MEYTLHLTPKGMDKYQGQGYKNPFSDFPTFSVPNVSLWERFTSNFFLFTLFRHLKDLLQSLMRIIFGNPLLILVFTYLNYRLLRWVFLSMFRWLWPRTQVGQRRPPPSFWPSFFGRGGWWGGDDPPGPPPPYTRQRPPSSRKTYYVPPETQGWTPGFWTGLASGAAAGYGFGSRGSGSGTQTREQERYNTRMYTENPAPQSSGWFGSGSSFSGGVSYNASGRRDRDDNGNSGSTHTSTGFGGTRRR